MKDVGVQIAIDDFGTGYSVLSHLKSLPVDTLKIDKSFVRELGTNPGDLAIVRAVIALAESFGLELVAEGVETEEAALTLLRHGCYRAQGFLLSRPVDGEAMESLLGPAADTGAVLRSASAVTGSAGSLARCSRNFNASDTEPIAENLYPDDQLIAIEHLIANRCNFYIIRGYRS